MKVSTPYAHNLIFAMRSGVVDAAALHAQSSWNCECMHAVAAVESTTHKSGASEHVLFCKGTTAAPCVQWGLRARASDRGSSMHKGDALLAMHTCVPLTIALLCIHINPAHAQAWLGVVVHPGSVCLSESKAHRCRHCGRCTAQCAADQLPSMLAAAQAQACTATQQSAQALQPAGKRMVQSAYHRHVSFE